MSETVLRQLQEAGCYLFDNGLSWGNAGNLSARLPDAPKQPASCLITASGTRLGCLNDDDLVACPIDPTASFAPARKPSKELPMHTAIYRQRPEINAVLHASPFYSTLVASSELEVPADLFVEGMYYLERVARVPYHHPGSQGMAKAVEHNAWRANVLLLDNHGVLVYDTSISEALMALHTLEIACHMLLAARSANLPLRPVPPASVRDFLDHSGYRPPRRWPGGAAKG